MNWVSRQPKVCLVCEQLGKLTAMTFSALEVESAANSVLPLSSAPGATFQAHRAVSPFCSLVATSIDPLPRVRMLRRASVSVMARSSTLSWET